MAQQDLIKIHHVDVWENLIAPHPDLVGMLQLVRNTRKVTIITKEPGKEAELIELLLFSNKLLNETDIYGLQKIQDEIAPYMLKAPTVDTNPATPIEHPRNLGVGLVLTITKFENNDDPKEWSRKYHIEIDQSVVRQTNDAVIIEHNIEGLTPETPVNFSIEPTIRGEVIQFHKSGSGALTIALLRNEMRYRVMHENVRSDGSQDNHSFYIPAVIAVKDLLTEPTDVPALELHYDDGSQLPTEIKLNETLKRTILGAITDIDIDFEADYTDRLNEILKLKLTFKQLNPDLTQVSPSRYKEVEIHLPALIPHWGEIEGDLADQTDLQTILNAKANTVADFEMPDGSQVILDLPEVPIVIDGKIAEHNTDELSHDDIRQEIAATNTALEQTNQDVEDTKQQITDDIAGHNVDETAHESIRTKITTDIATHDATSTAHQSLSAILRSTLQNDFNTILSAHNTSGDSHAVIQGAWNTHLEEHNQDPNEDQHPLLRSRIEAIETNISGLITIPSITGLSDGEYKLVISNGAASWQLI